MKNKLFGVIALIIGIGICIYSVSNFKNTEFKKKNYVETTAYVVDFEQCELDDNEYGTRYIAEYVVGNKKYRISENGCSSVSVKINSDVKVKYNPDNPNEAIFANDISHYIIPAVGIVFAICGIILIVKRNN